MIPTTIKAPVVVRHPAFPLGGPPSGRMLLHRGAVGGSNRRMHQQPRYPAKPWLTFSVLAAAVMSFTLVQSMTNPVLGTIERHLDTDPNTGSWVLTAYLLSAAILTPIIGRLGDAYGKRRMVLLSLGALALGSLIAALAPSIEVMILARIVQGAGGGVLPLAYSIIRDEFPAESVTGALGNVSSLLAVGVGVGTIIAGPIVTHLGYAWLFWLPMLVSLIAASAASIVIPDSQVRRPGRVPLLPTLLLAAGLVALLLPLSRGPRWGWASPAVIGLITAAVVCLSAWLVAERRAADPLIDMSMMSMRAIWSANLVSILGGVGMYASTAYLPMFIQTPSDLGYGFGASLTRSGLLVAPVAAGSFFVGLVVGRVIRRHGPPGWRRLVRGPRVPRCSYSPSLTSRRFTYSSQER